jgi:hypothetical protein
MSVAPEAFRSSLIALESFLLEYPEEAVGTVILRSQDSYDFVYPSFISFIPLPYSERRS